MPEAILDEIRKGSLPINSASPNRIELPPEGAELTYFATDLIVTPADNPPHSPAMLDALEASIDELGQLVPGWVCPSPDLPAEQRLCFEGNGRLEACRRLNKPFWAFDLRRFVDEEERIRLMFHHHGTRRRWSLKEIAERAALWLEITGATQAEAARRLGCSGPTLSRAFGEKRIPDELRPKTDLLGHSIRSLVAASPLRLMPQVVDFALKAREDGKRPTRDQVAGYIRQLKRNDQAKGRKPRSLTLRMNGRTVTLAVAGDKDSAGVALEDLKAIVARLGKHADVPLDGWPFLFST